MTQKSSLLPKSLRDLLPRFLNRRVLVAFAFLAIAIAAGHSEWLLLVVLLSTLWGSIKLQLRYEQPYTLMSASARQKWRWAFNLASLQILPFVLGLLALVVLPRLFAKPASPDLGMSYFMYCVGPVLLIFPLGVLWKRGELERALNLYIWRNKQRSNPAWQVAQQSLLTKRYPRSEEHRRFVQEGYPDGEINGRSERIAGYVAWVSFVLPLLILGLFILAVLLYLNLR